MYVPIIKNGPKGTSLLKVFFFNNINITPIIAPIKKEKNKATNIAGYPKNKPIKPASLTSPIPMALPRENSTIAKKKAAAPIAANAGEATSPLLKLKINAAIIAAYIMLSGII